MADIIGSGIGSFRSDLGAMAMRERRSDLS